MIFTLVTRKPGSGVFTLVTPAEAGVQLVYLIVLMDIRGRFWIPAYAGMTAC